MSKKFLVLMIAFSFVVNSTMCRYKTEEKEDQEKKEEVQEEKTEKESETVEGIEGYRDTRWGMSIEEVANILEKRGLEETKETKKIVDILHDGRLGLFYRGEPNKNNHIEYCEEYFGQLAYVTYFFEKPKGLRNVLIEISQPSEYKEKRLFFSKIKQVFCAKYGEREGTGDKYIWGLQRGKTVIILERKPEASTHYSDGISVLYMERKLFGKRLLKLFNEKVQETEEAWEKF